MRIEDADPQMVALSHALCGCLLTPSGWHRHQNDPRAHRPQDVLSIKLHRGNVRHGMRERVTLSASFTFANSGS
jgi:hypothetical protein